MVKEVLQTNYLHVDETPIKVLDQDKKGTKHRGYFWVYHNSHHKIVIFDYRKGRSGEGPSEILKEFNGHLQADGYQVYEDFNDSSGITLLHCIACPAFSLSCGHIFKQVPTLHCCFKILKPYP